MSALSPSLPFEFLVCGVPVSLQNRGRRSLVEWKGLIRDSYVRLLAEDHWASDQRLFVTIFYFPDGPMRGDIDNIAKPILDAMSGYLYLDDGQIERLVVQKFEPDRMVTFINPTPTLAAALETDRPVVYLRLDDVATVEESRSR